MIASGSGTRSAVPMMVETKFMWPLPSVEARSEWPYFPESCLRWQRKESTRTQLIVAIALAAGAQQLLLQRRDAGRVNQDPVHEDRRQQRRDTPGVIERQADGRIGKPAEPFEEVVGMARPAPQPDIADPALVGRIFAECLELRIGQRLAGNANKQEGRAEKIPRTQRVGRKSCRDKDRKRQRDRSQRLILQEDEHPPRRIEAPFPGEGGVARIVGDA